jgi:hypothetical protein
MNQQEEEGGGFVKAIQCSCEMEFKILLLGVEVIHLMEKDRVR